MYIKEVLEYDWNYAEYIISDGKNELICMCESVPLLSGQIPKVGMQVAQVYAFAIDEIRFTKVDESKIHGFNIKKCKRYFEYVLQCKIVDKDKALLCIGELMISLEKDFENGLPVGFENGDFVEFKADRLDCTLE